MGVPVGCQPSWDVSALLDTLPTSCLIKKKMESTKMLLDSQVSKRLTF